MDVRRLDGELVAIVFVRGADVREWACAGPHSRQRGHRPSRRRLPRLSLAGGRLATGTVAGRRAPVTRQPRPGTWRRTAASAAQHTSMAIAMSPKNDAAPRYSRAQAPT